MIDEGDNQIMEKGCEHLSKLESENVELIDLSNWSTKGTDRWMKLLKTDWKFGGRGVWRLRPRR